MKLSDYGIRGPWQVADCDGCGNRRSCLVAQESRGEDVETFAQCVPCIVKDIRAMERAQVEAEGGDPVAEEWKRNAGKGYFDSEDSMRAAYNRREAEGGEA